MAEPDARSGVDDRRAASPPAPPRRSRARASAPRPGRAAAIVWIVVSGILLAGVVFVNVAVLRLNLSLDTTNTSARSCAPRTPRCSRSIRRCVASRAIQAAAASSRPRRPGSVGYVERREVMRDKQANRRIRLLLVIFALVFAAMLRARRVAAGRARRDARPHGRAAASRDGRRSRPAAARSSTDRRAARDRRADDDGLRRPAAGRRPARGRGRGPPHPRRRRERALPAAPEPQDGVRLRPALRRPAEGGRVHEEGLHRRQLLPRGERAYPQGSVAAQVVGYAGTDNKGLGGLEVEYDRQLTGKPGKQTIVRDPFGQAIDVVSADARAEGADVFSTIDHKIQAKAERCCARRSPSGTRGRRPRSCSTRHRRGARDGAGAGLQRERLVAGAAGATSRTARSPTCTSPARCSSS